MANSQISSPEIREKILAVIAANRPNSPSDNSLQFNDIVRGMKSELGLNLGQELQEEILTQFHDLMRTGHLAWGANLSNPDPPFFHITRLGDRTLSRLSRDPGNPSGYLRHLQSACALNPIAESYIIEALECFKSGLYKAAAVMVGTASESILLEIRDSIVDRQKRLNETQAKGLTDWRAKIVFDGVTAYLPTRIPRDLNDLFSSYFSAFLSQIRTIRNDAGHPNSVAPVTEESVHSSLLIFPELARLAGAIETWTKGP